MAKSKRSAHVLKDVDLTHILQQDTNQINLNLVDKITLMRQLQRDVGFLEKLGLMDYSLLLVIEERSSTKQSFEDLTIGRSTKASFIGTLSEGLNKGSYLFEEVTKPLSTASEPKSTARNRSVIN